MKRNLLTLLALLLFVGVTCWVVLGRADAPKHREPHPSSEKREAREARRAERLASYEKFIDSLVLSRHMGYSSTEDPRNVSAAFEMFPLAFALSVADSEATYFIEKDNTSK